MKCLHFKSSVVHPNFSLCSLQPEVGREINFAHMVYDQKVNRIRLASPTFTNYHKRIIHKLCGCPIDSFMLPNTASIQDDIEQQYAATLLKVQTL